MKKINLLCIVLLFIMATPNLSYSADMDDVDGNGWREFPASYKYAYVAGFLVGSGYVVESNQYSVDKDYDNDKANKLDNEYWRFVIEQNEDNAAKGIFTHQEVGILLEKQRVEKNQHLTRYVFRNAVYTTQVADGLDKVYEDFKNRSIKLRDAVYLVKNQIEGTPQEDIERILLFLRGGKRDYVKHLLIKDEKGKIIRFIKFP